jgi:hypothetical protein
MTRPITQTNQRFTFARHPFTREVLARRSLRALVVERDELERLHAAFLRADALLDTPTPAIKEPAIAVEYREALMAGEPLPKNLGARKVKAEAEAAAVAAEDAALRRVHNDLGIELTLLAKESVPAMIEGLDAELHEVIDHAAEQLAALGGSIDPLRAMRTKKADAFQALAEDHEAFLRIRSDADLILVEEAGRPAIDDDHALFRIMRNAGSIWPDWRVSREGPQYEGVMKRYDTAPWPSDVASLAFFAWLVQHAEEAGPWVPSYSQLQARPWEHHRGPQPETADAAGPRVRGRAGRTGQLRCGPAGPQSRRE